MKRPRVSLRSLLFLIGVLAVLLAASRLLGPRPGAYSMRYWYIDARWPFYHEVQGASITVFESGMIIVD